MNKNVFRCRVCGRFAISEELDSHECRGLKDYFMKNGVVWVFDGYLWYPLDPVKFDPTKIYRNKIRHRLYRT